MATLSITARATGSTELIKTQALAVLMPERKTLAPALKALDNRLGGTVTRSLQNGDFTGSAGSQLWLPGAGNVDRVLLVGCGDPGKLNAALLAAELTTGRFVPHSGTNAAACLSGVVADATGR